MHRNYIQNYNNWYVTGINQSEWTVVVWRRIPEDPRCSRCYNHFLLGTRDWPGIQPGWLRYCKVVRGPRIIAAYEAVWLNFNIFTRNMSLPEQSIHTDISPSDTHPLRLRLLSLKYFSSSAKFFSTFMWNLPRLTNHPFYGPLIRTLRL